MSNNNIVKAEYIWIDGTYGFRSKTRVIYTNQNNHLDIELYPVWNFDGSSTNQADGNDSEVLLNPVRVVNDPFNTMTHESCMATLVLCETVYPDGSYPDTSTRHIANDIFNKNLDAKPWYGIEQEFYIFTKQTADPLTRFNHDKYDNYEPLGKYKESQDGEKTICEKQGRYYCSVGGTCAFGRDIVSTALEKCIQCGLHVSGMNAEVGPGQWEIQVGPCEGIQAGDEISLLRYILYRVSEDYGKNNIEIVFDPKPLKGDWNGSGCHTNYSTLDMRNGTDQYSGYDYIKQAINKLEKAHEDHMQNYGVDNIERMTGLHETASYDVFTYGIADRTASIRIPTDTYKNKKGYLEDRRPGANMDPYIVTSKLFETTVLK